MEKSLYSMTDIWDCVYDSVVSISGSQPRNPSCYLPHREPGGPYLYDVLNGARRRIQLRVGVNNWQPTVITGDKTYYYNPDQVKEILQEVKSSLDRRYKLGMVYRRIPLNEQILESAVNQLFGNNNPK